MARLVSRSVEARLQRRPHLFLSHSSKDKPFVRDLAENLNTCEVDVWLDEWEIRVGDSLHEVLSNAIERSEYVALVISSNFNESDWASSELKQALARERREGRAIILPLIIGDASIPPFVEDKAYLDFRSKYYHALSRLAGMVLKLSVAGVERGLMRLEPGSLADCLGVLRYAGHEPYTIVDEHVFRDIVAAGGLVKGDRVKFDPEKVMRHPGVSEMTRDLMRKLRRAW